MWGCTASLATIMNCLKHTPRLTTLKLHSVASDELLGHLIVPNTKGEVLVPKLEALHLLGGVLSGMPSLLQVIRSRWENPEEVEPLATTAPGHPRSLKSVLVIPPGADELESQRKKQLLALNDEGFDVRVGFLDKKAFLSHNNFEFPNPGCESFFVDKFCT